jgi:adenosylcobinamide-GDP ribazoletransferase
MIKSFLMQLGFLTRIPLIKVKFDNKTFSKGIIFSPVIGLMIGGFLAGIFLLSSFLNNKILSSIIIVFSLIIITGGLHLDGLADTCDGIFSYRDKDKILEIMRDPRIGANGTIALIMLILFKIILIYSLLNSENIIKYLLIFPVFARNNIIISSGISNYAGNISGMGEDIVKNTGIKQIIIGIIFTSIICMPVILLRFFIFFIISLIFVLTFTFYIKRKIGGITGDIIGAIIELTEITMLSTAIILETPFAAKFLSEINI